MATAGAVVEVRVERVSVMPVDKELVESTGEDQRDTEAINKIKSVLGIPGDEPLMDALGERGIVLRVDDTAGGGVDEYIVPWSIAETISHRVFVMNFDDDENGARAAAEYSTNPSSNGRGHAHRGDYVGPVPDVVGTERVTMPETQIPAYDPVPDPPSAHTEPGSSRIEL
ncbi:hypothetical protein ACIPYS_09610 [Kitasatospora sp. NPDC089913]|uniref:hypothetical protein n=1 Tax=Kitasatospora sp. NPDC089913 TaxID=3364080 RepID=UPI0037FF06CB